MTKETETDEAFFARADQIIATANNQIDDASPGKVSASTLFAAARFNAFVTAQGFETGADMQDSIDEMLDYFVPQYRDMLKEHLEDYAKNFAKYTGRA